MGWRTHLQHLLLAGGSLALSSCQGCCNANPDPCCGAPESQRCKDEQACLARDEDWYGGACVPLDQGVPDLADASPDDAADDHD